MNLVLRKIGNSVGVILPKEILDRFGLKEGDNVEINTVNGQIILQPERADLAEQLKAARVGMEKYRIALRELAK